MLGKSQRTPGEWVFKANFPLVCLLRWDIRSSADPQITEDTPHKIKKTSTVLDETSSLLIFRNVHQMSPTIQDFLSFCQSLWRVCLYCHSCLYPSFLIWVTLWTSGTILYLFCNIRYLTTCHCELWPPFLNRYLFSHWLVITLWYLFYIFLF